MLLCPVVASGVLDSLTKAKRQKLLLCPFKRLLVVVPHPNELFDLLVILSRDMDGIV